jgi:ketosteroid isomerase-like protein
MDASIINSEEMDGLNFSHHRLIHNKRKIQKIVISKEGDGAFAVVDRDTFWRRISDGKDFRWNGRACKIYTKLDDGDWKMISQTALDYSIISGPE